MYKANTMEVVDSDYKEGMGNVVYKGPDASDCPSTPETYLLSNCPDAPKKRKIRFNIPVARRIRFVAERLAFV